MSDYHDNQEEDSIHESILTKQNKSIQSIQSNRIDMEPKVNASFYMRKSIADAGRLYARRAGLSVGTFIEQSLILFMDVNPIEFFGLNVSRPEPNQQTFFQSDLEEIVIIDDLEELLSILRRLSHDVPKARKKDFLNIAKQYLKLKNPSDKITNLMKEAKSYFE